MNPTLCGLCVCGKNGYFVNLPDESRRSQCSGRADHFEAGGGFAIPVRGGHATYGHELVGLDALFFGIK